MGWNEVKNANSEKMPYTKFSEGLTKIRVLSDEPYSFWQHWIPQLKTSAVCPGKGCPICNIIAQQKANKETPKYNSSHRHAMLIWNYTTNQQEIMIQGSGFMQNLLALHEEVGDIRTYDIKIKRMGTDKNTTYTALPTAPTDFEFTDECNDVDLSTMFTPATEDEIMQLLDGKSWSEIRGVGDGEESVA